MNARPWVLWAAAFAGAALISGFTILRGLDPFDEGLALQAARRVSDGQLPYRDFLWAYGPAGPYALAGLRELLEPSLIHWRVLRVLADAGVATIVLALVLRETRSRPLALCPWALAACAIAQPRSANPAALALLAGLAAFAIATGGERPTARRAAVAGALVGVTAAIRYDFGLYAFAAVAVALALRPGGERRGRVLAALAGTSAAVAAAVYGPFVVAIGPADLYDALIGTSFREGGYWRLPFPLRYRGGLGGPVEWKDALDFYVPLLVVVGVLAAVVTAALTWRGERRAPWLAAGLLAFAGGGLAYLVSRIDAFHVQPLEIVVAVLLPVSIAAARRRRALVVVPAAVLALLTTHAIATRAVALFDPPRLSTVDVAVADGAKAPPREARALERTVALVDGLVPPGEPIYVLPRRSDLAPLTAPLVYVLAERDNPTRADHGLLTGAADQRSIVATLERVRPRALVRWTDPLSSKPEPNRRGRSSGVRLLDDWVAAHYRLRQRAGSYDVLVPR